MSRNVEHTTIDTLMKKRRDRDALRIKMRAMVEVSERVGARD